ncbi:MAG: hypothetical protein ACOCP4_03870 [Candidatus Woesearchaeota archaeon]|uniref:Uncharacterized protein n=1 Tax=Arfiviricetes sp. TaxID=2832556 RepID=A0AB39A3B0_9VIRU
MKIIQVTEQCRVLISESMWNDNFTVQTREGNQWLSRAGFNYIENAVACCQLISQDKKGNKIDSIIIQQNLFEERKETKC